jgi:hypothetical protein
MKRLRNDGVNKDQLEAPIMEHDHPGLDREGNPLDPEHFDAGMTADPGDADMIGSPPYELEPRGDDILPDQIQRFAGAPSEEDVEVTARPRESMHPLSPDELPEG